jgi:steroid delta-isomerase-like uncharacterized protein
MDATTVTAADLAHAAFHGIFVERDLSDPYRYWTDESVDHFLGAGVTVRGAEGLAQWFRDLFAAVPDWTLEIERCVDDGDRTAMVQWRASGTMNGSTPFLGIEPNGRRIELRGVDVMSFDPDGKVSTNTVYYDGAGFARDIGMLPPRDSALDRALLAAFNGATKLKKRLRPLTP